MSLCKDNSLFEFNILFKLFVVRRVELYGVKDIERFKGILKRIKFMKFSVIVDEELVSILR